MRVDLHATFAAEVEPHVERDLVVATSAGMQLGAGRARDLGDAALDRRVDVFVGRRERERARRELLVDTRQGRRDHLPLLLGEQADRFQHLHVRARAGEIVDGQAPVVRKADREREQLVGRALAEPPRPERLPGRLAFVTHAAATSGPRTPVHRSSTVRASGSAPGHSCGCDLRPSNTRASVVNGPGLRICAWPLMRLRPPALEHPCIGRQRSGPPDLRLATHAEPGPWRRDHVCAESPHKRTKPSESSCRNASSAS